MIGDNGKGFHFQKGEGVKSLRALVAPSSCEKIMDTYE